MFALKLDVPMFFAPTGGNTCWVSACEMVLQYHGYWSNQREIWTWGNGGWDAPVANKRIREILLHFSNENMAVIAVGAQKYRYIEKVIGKKYPFIAMIAPGRVLHSVVAIGYGYINNRDYVLYNDPVRGYREDPYDDFYDMWRGTFGILPGCSRFSRRFNPIQADVERDY